MFKVNDKVFGDINYLDMANFSTQLRIYFISFASVFMVNFEQVKVCWEITLHLVENSRKQKVKK